MDASHTLCSNPPFVHARTASMAATIFAAWHGDTIDEPQSNRTTLYFAIENVSTGLLQRWAGEGWLDEQPSTTAMARSERLLGRSHTASDSSVAKLLSNKQAPSIPQVSTCGQRSRLLRQPRCILGEFSLMCRIVVFDHRAAGCPIELHWPGFLLRATASLCRRPMDRRADRVFASVVAPVYFTGSGTTHEGAHGGVLRRLTQWVARWSPQVEDGRVHIHAFNKGELVQREMEEQHGALIAAGRLELTQWDFFEEMMRLRPDQTHVVSSFTEQRPLVFAITKSLLELRGRSEWLIVVDIDEFWVASQTDAALQTAASFLRALPSTVQQHPFCTVDACVDDVVQWRPKSALRIGRGACEFWGHPHAGVTVERFDTSVSCSSLDHVGKPVDVFHMDGGRIWSVFNPFCRRQMEASPATLHNYIAHERGGHALCVLGNRPKVPQITRLGVLAS